MESVYYVGMDVHKDSIRMAVLRGGERDTVYEATFKNDISRIIRKLKDFSAKDKVIAAYEAGCMGYTLQRSLSDCGIECRVIAPNKLDRSGSQRIKTDARDAVLIARMIKHDEADTIRIPSRDDEAARDLLRCREDIKAELQRTRHQLSNLLLRSGYIYPGETHWTAKHKEWMQKLVFNPLPKREAFDQYFSHMTELEARLDRIDDNVTELAQTEPYRDKVARLRCLKGIEYLTALACVCEIGDFRRFPSAESFMSYLGLVPSERSSGAKRRQGGITKIGNSHIRKLLIEAGWHYRFSSPASKALKERRKGMDELVIAYADKALHRLSSKFKKLVSLGKSSKTAVTATARELAGFIWGLMVECY